MKLSINKVFGLLSGLLLTVISSSSWATEICRFAEGVTQTEAVPLSPAVISAGADIPVGTIIYQGSWIMRNSKMECSWALTDVGKSFWYRGATIINNNTPFPPSDLATGPFAGAVYQTNAPGVGVAILYSNGVPLTQNTPSGSDVEYVIKAGEGGGGFDIQGATRYIVLIKTGPMTPGNYQINASNFPTVKTTIEQAKGSYSNSVPVTGLPLTAYNISFQGSLTVSTQTCTTPDVSVGLGTYDISEHFKGINSTTPWVDASIVLTNCPTFYGFYNATNTTLMMNYKTGESIVTSSLNNSIGVRLTPTTEVKDAVNGIMAIDSSVSGAASGVGIQLGWGVSSQTPTLFNFATEQSVMLPKDGSPTIRVPLAARYIQTDARPTPGKANGKVVFMINYY